MRKKTPVRDETATLARFLPNTKKTKAVPFSAMRFQKGGVVQNNLFHSGTPTSLPAKK
jgi:hypothetical protein